MPADRRPGKIQHPARSRNRKHADPRRQPAGAEVTVTAKTYQLKAAAEPAGAVQTVTWATSDKKIATVSTAGKVTFKKAGTVIITATAKDGSGVSVAATITYAPTSGKSVSEANTEDYSRSAPGLKLPDIPLPER